MNIPELIQDWIIGTDLFETLFSRKDAITKVCGIQQPITKHIIKYLYYDVSEDTKNHWISEIDKWLVQIDEIELKNGKHLSGDMYYKVLFDEPLGELSSLTRIVKNIDKVGSMDVHDKIGTMPELHGKCEKILRMISYDITNDKLEDFKYYVRHI